MLKDLYPKCQNQDGTFKIFGLSQWSIPISQVSFIWYHFSREWTAMPFSQICLRIRVHLRFKLKFHLLPKVSVLFFWPLNSFTFSRTCLIDNARKLNCIFVLHVCSKSYCSPVLLMTFQWMMDCIYDDGFIGL